MNNRWYLSVAKQPIWHLICITLVAFGIRAFTFHSYIQHEQRYRQADSFDYHFCAAGLATGHGMHRLDNKEPLFWRTPGYPLFLKYFYHKQDGIYPQFEYNKNAHIASLWIQILLCSLIPFLIYLLSFALTASYTLSFINAWISVFHIGYVFASCFLLSDALAHIFFLLFLYFLYKSFLFWFEKTKYISFKHSLGMLALSALSLGVYTWMRPNGQFIIMIGMVFLLLSNDSWSKKIMKIVAFGTIFFASISPWYLRNYNLTGSWFFCPISGPYLQSFCAPKIVRRITGQPLEQCIQALLRLVVKEEAARLSKLKQEGSHLKICRELICLEIAKPWLKKYPGYFLYDWTKEVLKTTFDLYSSQLVAMVNKTHTYDPLEEFLTEKIELCLYKQQMPWFMRLICWFEFIMTCLMWFGIAIGMLMLTVKSITQKSIISTTLALWIKTGLMIGGLVVMTGGFGYARLRIPADPLMILLSTLSWYTFYHYKKTHNHSLQPAFL